MVFLTSQQAYLAMFAFLKEEFKLTGSDEIGSHQEECRCSPMETPWTRQ
ncbi:hypothetical protein [Massilia pseudoviolaceinigra]|nr:hypothetical protein [Massilia sp. CCM 9206]MDQ1924789.1 hypothetical protein [Massilia sp. CCM 9206]